jgi:hypothetical protein
MQLLQVLEMDDIHLIDKYLVRRCLAVSVKLNGVAELISAARVKCVVTNIEHVAYAVNRKRIVNNNMSGRIVVIFRDKVVPRPRRESHKRQAAVIPLFCAVIKDSPLITGVVGLECEVVNPSIEGLLAFEFNGLRRVFQSVGNKEIKLIGKRIDLRGHRTMLLEEVGIGKGGIRRNAELRGDAVLAGRSYAKGKGEIGKGPASPGIATGAAGEPIIFLNILKHD